MNLSLNPLYRCNYRCPWCYLTNQQLSDRKKINLNDLNDRLEEISSIENIDFVDLYGGEVALLPETYFENLCNVVNKFYNGKINIITNFSKIVPGFSRKDVDITVSFDGIARPKYQEVLNNIIIFERPIHVLVLACREVLNQNYLNLINIFNNISNIITVEIKPYSTNQANQHEVSFMDFENYVKLWLDYPNKDFVFINELNIQDCLNGLYNTFSDDHVYITPNGKFAVLEFDENDNEYFLELESFDKYLEWTKIEKNRVHANSYCNKCEFLGSCLSEHLRNVKDLTNSCNGFKGLLDYYEQMSG